MPILSRREGNSRLPKNSRRRSTVLVLACLVTWAASWGAYVRGDEPAPPASPSPLWVVDDAPPPPPRPKLWTGGVEFGVNGDAGNSENFKMHLSANAKRATPDDVLTADVLYVLASAGSVRTEDRLLANARDEWLFRCSIWSLFTSGSAEYDQFKDFDVRLAAHSGVGCRLFKTDWTCLKGRLGVGGSHEFGGPNNRLVPEGLVGGDFEQKITVRQKFVASAEFFPDLSRWDGYRGVGKLAYDILVDPDLNMNLRLGLLDTYENNAGKAKRNDLEYFAVLLFKF